MTYVVFMPYGPYGNDKFQLAGSSTHVIIQVNISAGNVRFILLGNQTNMFALGQLLFRVATQGLNRYAVTILFRSEMICKPNKVLNTDISLIWQELSNTSL